MHRFRPWTRRIRGGRPRRRERSAARRSGRSSSVPRPRAALDRDGRRLRASTVTRRDATSRSLPTWRRPRPPPAIAARPPRAAPTTAAATTPASTRDSTGGIAPIGDGHRQTDGDFRRDQHARTTITAAPLARRRGRATAPTRRCPYPSSAPTATPARAAPRAPRLGAPTPTRTAPVHRSLTSGPTDPVRSSARAATLRTRRTPTTPRPSAGRPPRRAGLASPSSAGGSAFRTTSARRSNAPRSQLEREALLLLRAAGGEHEVHRERAVADARREMRAHRAARRRADRRASPRRCTSRAAARCPRRTRSPCSDRGSRPRGSSSRAGGPELRRAVRLVDLRARSGSVTRDVDVGGAVTPRDHELQDAGADAAALVDDAVAVVVVRVEAQLRARSACTPTSRRCRPT